MTQILCPTCKKEIDYLVNVQSGYMRYDMDKKGNYDYKNEEFSPDDSTNDWECPECEDILATNEEDALKFLNGEE
jgi:hypothetical protein